MDIPVGPMYQDVKFINLIKQNIRDNRYDSIRTEHFGELSDKWLSLVTYYKEPCTLTGKKRWHMEYSLRHTMKRIDQQYPIKSEDCCRMMFMEWLKRNDSWMSLTSVLESCDEHVLASKVKPCVEPGEVYVCVHAYTCLHLHVCARVCTCVHVHMYMSINTKAQK